MRSAHRHLQNIVIKIKTSTIMVNSNKYNLKGDMPKIQNETTHQYSERVASQMGVTTMYISHCII